MSASSARPFSGTVKRSPARPIPACCCQADNGKLSRLLREEEEKRCGLQRCLAEAEERAAAASDFGADLALARCAASEAVAATAEDDPLRPLLSKLDRKMTALEQRKDKVEDGLRRELGLRERKVAALERQLREVHEELRGGIAGGAAAVVAKDEVRARLLRARMGGISAARDDTGAGGSPRAFARVAKASGGGGGASARGSDDPTNAERAESNAELVRMQRDQRLARLDPEAAASEAKRRADMAELRNRIIMTQARAAAESRGQGQSRSA